MDQPLNGFRINKSPYFLGNLALASGSFWKYNKEAQALPSYFTLTLHPYEIKKEHFDVIRDAEIVWFKLLVSLAEKMDWIQKIHADLKNDVMIGNLMKIAKKIYDQKIKKVTNFFILRADYVFNQDKQVFQQTQFNAFAPGMWTLSDAAQDFHRALQPLKEKPSKVYYEPIRYKLIAGFKQVFDIYCKQYKVKAGILIVAQGNYKDIIEQAQIQKLLLISGIPVIKAPFSSLNADRLQLNQQNRSLTVDGLQIAVVYYRQGYHPSHYLQQGSWLARQKLEISRAICVPDVFIHLINFKNVQTQLKTTDIMRQHLSQTQTQLLLKVQTTIFPYEQVLNKKQQLIEQYGERLVVKSIHEGSSQNYFYKQAIQKLRQLPAKDIIVMEYIKPNNRRVQVIGQNNSIKEYDGISQVGVFGVCIYKNAKQIYKNQYVGYMIRTFEDSMNDLQLNYEKKAIDSLSLI